MSLQADYCDGYMISAFGPDWADFPELKKIHHHVYISQVPLWGRIDELTRRCRAAGVDVSDLED